MNLIGWNSSKNGYKLHFNVIGGSTDSAEQQRCRKKYQEVLRRNVNAQCRIFLNI